MSDAFWAERAADDAEHAAAKREAKRASQEREVLDRVGPDAAGRLCCQFRFVHPDEFCDEGACLVLAATLG